MSCTWSKVPTVPEVLYLESPTEHLNNPGQLGQAQHLKNNDYNLKKDIFKKRFTVKPLVIRINP